MKSNIEIEITIKPDLRWRDAIKLRLAGGKYMASFWDAFAERVRNAGSYPMNSASDIEGSNDGRK